MVVLVCPRCRDVGRASPIVAGERRCADPACGAVYDVRPGTDVVDLRLAHRGHPLDDAPTAWDDPGRVASRLARLTPGSRAWDAAVTLGMYVRANYRGDLPERLFDRFVVPLGDAVRRVVDLGCGVGGFANRLAGAGGCAVVGVDGDPVALDVAWAADRAGVVAFPSLHRHELTIDTVETAPGADVTWVCGDVLAPPLMPASFDLVTAVNLLDSVGDPLVALGQASALAAPGGWLLVVHPGAWSADVTPPERWIDDDTWEAAFDRYGLDVVDRADGFDWQLERTPRWSYRYVAEAILLRRRT